MAGASTRQAAAGRYSERRGTASPAVQAAAFHDQFVHRLSAGAHSYVSADAANLSLFSANPVQTIGQDLSSAINAPSLAFTGRLVIGNGATRLRVRGKTAQPAVG